MIGIFDSGVGGLTVLRAVERLLPNADLLYFGDTARAPYGTKGEATIRRFAEQDTRLLLDAGATVLVVACHTMASVALDAIRAVAGATPVFDVVSATIEAVRKLVPRRVGVIGTRATVGSKVYERALAPTPVTALACPLLVPLIEEGWADRPEARRIIRTYLGPFRSKPVDALVLGCTHYPLVVKTIQAKMGRRVRVVDPSDEVAKDIARSVGARGSGARRYQFSDVTPVTKTLAERWLGHPVSVEIVSAERE